MLGVSPIRSPARERAIAERERLCGVKFPAAVVEWFALADAERLFHENSNEDDLVTLAELGDPEETRQGYLRVAIENQAVVAFYVRLDEGDDPPVYDNNDEFLEPQLDRIDWQLLSVSYTNFIFDMVCVHRLRAYPRKLYLEATADPPDAAALAVLSRRLRPGPVKSTSEVELRRFFGPHEYAYVRWSPGGEAQWHIEADSPEVLAELRAALEGIVGFPPPSPAPPRRRSLWNALTRRSGGGE